MNGLLVLHMISLGMWAGCITVEMLLEQTHRGDFTQKKAMARIHYLIDKYVELPLLLLVLCSGFLLLNTERLSGKYLLKVICGLWPVVINLLCLIPVFRRRHAADRNDEKSVDNYTWWIYAAFFSGLAGGAVALVLGLNLGGII